MNYMFGNYFTPNPDYKEILRLERMLSNAGIPHTCGRVFDGWKVCYPSDKDKEIVMDAIEHYGSFGHGNDTLEIMGLLTPEEEEVDSVLGNLSADEVFARIWFHHTKQWDYFCNLNKTPEVTEEGKPETPILTPEEFTKAMKDISDKLANPPKYRPYYDEEDAHMEMDDLMLDLLRSLGYGDGVDIFENTNKWYA